MMLAVSPGVEYCRVSRHVVKMKFGEICCVPTFGGIICSNLCNGKEGGMKFSWEITYMKLYFVSSGPRLGRTQPQEHTFIINIPCGCII